MGGFSIVFVTRYQRVNIKSNNLKHQLSSGTGEKIHAHLQLAAGWAGKTAAQRRIRP